MLQPALSGKRQNEFIRCEVFPKNPASRCGHPSLLLGVLFSCLYRRGLDSFRLSDSTLPEPRLWEAGQPGQSGLPSLKMETRTLHSNEICPAESLLTNCILPHAQSSAAGNRSATAGAQHFHEAPAARMPPRVTSWARVGVLGAS